MRRAAAVAACLVVLAGCGGDGASAPQRPGPEADRAAVQARVAAYLRHYAAGDGARACAQFTPGLRSRSDARAAANGDRSCAAALSALGPEIVAAMPEGFAEQLADPAGVRVDLRGDRALATLSGPTANHLRLVRTVDDWLIDDLGVPAG
jgi:hypothetical protein